MADAVAERHGRFERSAKVGRSIQPTILARSRPRRAAPKHRALWYAPALADARNLAQLNRATDGVDDVAGETRAAAGQAFQDRRALARTQHRADECGSIVVAQRTHDDLSIGRDERHVDVGRRPDQESHGARQGLDGGCHHADGVGFERVDDDTALRLRFEKTAKHALATKRTVGALAPSQGSRSVTPLR